MKAAEAVPDVTLPELFERQVAQVPDAVAVVCGQTRWSYAEVEGRANRLARFLVSRGAGPGRLVGVAMGRSAELVVVLLAVLKAGPATCRWIPSTRPSGPASCWATRGQCCWYVTGGRRGGCRRATFRGWWWMTRKWQRQCRGCRPGRWRMRTAGPAEADGCGLCDLYVGVDGAAEGRDGVAPERGAAAHDDHRLVRFRARRCVGSVSFVRV